MLRKLILPLAFAALAAAPAQAQTLVTPYKPGVSPAGVTYYLPKTSIRFYITATCTTHHAGQFAEYAERFLAISDVVTTDTDSWTLDTVTAQLYATADESEAYTIALNPKSAAPLVTLMPSGQLLAVNTDVDFPAPLPDAAGVREVPVDNPVASDFFSEDFLRAGNNLKKAEIAAEEIYDIREKRNLLVDGEADFNPTDGQQLTAMLAKQDAREAGLKSLFTGTISRKSYSYVVDYTPTGSVTDHVLFRFSRHLGMVDADDLSGEPYMLTIVDETVKPEPVPEAEPTTAPAGLIPSGKQKTPAPVLDLRYRIPGHAHVTLSTTKARVYDQNISIAQFGHIEHLGGELFNKKFTTKVILDPLTGNIKNIQMAAPLK